MRHYEALRKAEMLSLDIYYSKKKNITDHLKYYLETNGDIKC